MFPPYDSSWASSSHSELESMQRSVEQLAHPPWFPPLPQLTADGDPLETDSDSGNDDSSPPDIANSDEDGDTKDERNNTPPGFAPWNNSLRPPTVEDLGWGPGGPSLGGGPAGGVGCDWNKARKECVLKWSYQNPGYMCATKITCTPMTGLCEMRPSCSNKTKLKLGDGKIKEGNLSIGVSF
jgi:hypothetical protein